jgi:hypothetical protein
LGAVDYAAAGIATSDTRTTTATDERAKTAAREATVRASMVGRREGMGYILYKTSAGMQRKSAAPTKQ